MKKVLVVEDDQFLANAYKLKLTISGFDAVVAFDGEQALQIVREFAPDLVLLDLIMPNMDGFACLSAMQADEALRKIPVIIASNLGQKEDIDKAMSMGAIDYVVKSNVSIEEIVQKVIAVIGT